MAKLAAETITSTHFKFTKFMFNLIFDLSINFLGNNWVVQFIAIKLTPKILHFMCILIR